MGNQTSFTFDLTNEQQEKLLDMWVDGGYVRDDIPYTVYAVSGKNFRAALYTKVRDRKRKLCVQGTGAREYVEFQLEPNGIVPVELGYEEIVHPESVAPHAGSDESGKGDYFGPLVACCAYVDEKLAAEMRKIGVKDCKLMTDSVVLNTGAALRELLGPDGFSVVKIQPAAYNRLYARIQNINRILAWAHGTAIEELLEKRPDCPRVVVDQFASTEATILHALKERGKKAKVEQRHKAEGDIAVAAASVIAREEFIRSCTEMAESIAVARIPLGSSDARVSELAETMVRRNGPTWLMNHCKVHFRTTDDILLACCKSREDLPPEGRVVSAAARTQAKHGNGLENN